jgi:hypothetical protein
VDLDSIGGRFRVAGRDGRDGVRALGKASPVALAVDMLLEPRRAYPNARVCRLVGL